MSVNLIGDLKIIINKNNALILPPTTASNYRSNKIRKMISNELGLKQETILLEIGSGWGKDSVILAPCVSYYIALEIGLEYCKRLKENFEKEKRKNYFIIKADGQNLPFRKGVFNVGFCRGVLHHAQHPQKIIFEFYRVVKKGSKVLAIEEPNALNPLWHLAKLLTRVFKIRKDFVVSSEFIQNKNEKDLGGTLNGPFFLYFLKQIFRKAHFNNINGVYLWLPYYAIYSKYNYFKIWLILEKAIEKTIIPNIFGQLFISGQK